MKKTKELWLIWRTKSEDNRRRYRIGTLTWNEDGRDFSFQYDHDVKLARENGLEYYPGFDDKDESYIYHSDSLFPNIASRLPRPERDDYLDYINRYGLDPTDKDYEVLIATKGRLVTDNFEFVQPFNRNGIEFEIAGVRHRQKDLERYAQEGLLRNGAKLRLEIDPDNKFDQNAVKILLSHNSEMLGYVPRYYSEYLARELSNGTVYSAVVSRVDLSTEIRDERVSVQIRLILN